MLNDRMVHESIPLSEEKRLVKEIKDLEKTRSKVISNAANRAKLQGTVVEKEAIQDQVKVSVFYCNSSFLFLHIFPREISGNHSLNNQIIGEGIDGIKKERQAVRSKIKVLEDELKLVDAELASLQEDLDAATARKDKAYESLQELRAVRDAKVSLAYLQIARVEIMSVLSVLLLCSVLGFRRRKPYFFCLKLLFLCLDIIVCACGCFYVLFTVYHLEMAMLG